MQFENQDFQIKVAEILVNALDDIEEPISDFDTLWDLFSFCFKVKDAKAMDVVLTKAPESTRHKLLVNYEENRKHNVLWEMLGRGSTTSGKNKYYLDLLRQHGGYVTAELQQNSDFMDFLEGGGFDGVDVEAEMNNVDRGNGDQDKMITEVILKHIEKPKLFEVLNDAANPKSKEERDYESALEKVVAKGNSEKFAKIKKMFADSKEDFEEQLTSSDSSGEPLLFKAINSGEESICGEILDAIGSDTAKMKVFNTRTKHNRKNVFANAKKNGLIKKTVTSILENIKSNKLKCDSFIPYFQWLITNNDLESIKALFEIFKKEKNAIFKFMASRLPDKRNVIALCCTHDDNVEMLEACSESALFCGTINAFSFYRDIYQYISICYFVNSFCWSISVRTRKI